MNPFRGAAPIESSTSPERSPEIRDELPIALRRNDWFTAVLLPVGAMAGVIVLFALWTTDCLIVPGFSTTQSEGPVTLFGVAIGSTEIAAATVWVIVLLTVFILIGAALGLLAGKGIGRLSQWGS